MTNYQWSPDSFEGRALQASRERKEEEQREEQVRKYQEQRARAARFARLMERVFGQYWPRVEPERRAHITELRHGDLLFSLRDVDGQREPVLSVAAECSRCGRAFERHPIGNSADVGDLLAELQQHPDCVHPMVRAAVQENR